MSIAFDNVLKRLNSFLYTPSLSDQSYHQNKTHKENHLGLKFLSIFKSIPIIGDLLEDITNRRIEPITLSKGPWKPRSLSTGIAMKKMWKNSEKAIAEHHIKERSEPYATLKEALHSIPSSRKPIEPTQSFSFTCTVAEEQGIRSSMEDAHFFAEIPQGIVTGLFDGHGGRAVANYASEQFQLRFSSALTKANDNVHRAFETLIHEIHKEVAAKKEWFDIGSTAVICFINNKTNRIYTATLGDSEANIYRKINGQLKSIPLSCVRDWSCKKDALRAAKVLNNPAIAKEWPLTPYPKYLRCFGVNVSRAIGDVSRTGTYSRPAIIHKPKITVNLLFPNDVLILSCDGLKDFVSEHEIIDQIKENALHSGSNLAKRLVEYAYFDNRSKDNITVMAIEIT